MSCKKLLAGCAVLLASAALTVVITCNGPDVTNPGENEILDGYSLELSKMYDSIRVADSIEQVRVKDSIRIVDSLALVRELDSMRFVDSLAYLRMMDSIKIFMDIIKTTEEKRVADSVAIEKALAEAENDRVRDSIQNYINFVRAKDSVDNITKLADLRKKFPGHITSVIGRGYDILGFYADDASKKAPVFDDVKLLLAGMIEDAYAERGTFQTTTGSSVKKVQESLTKNLSTNASLDVGKVASFKGQMEKNFSVASCQSEALAFATMKATVITSAYAVKYRSNANLLKDYLSEEFKIYVDTMKDYKMFINTYGTHVILGAKYGGRLDYSMTSRKKTMSNEVESAMKWKVEAKAGAWGVSVKAEAGGSESSKYQSMFEDGSEDIKTEYVGGAGKSAMGVHAGESGSKWSEWVASVDNRSVWCDFYENSLLPITEVVNLLVQDGSKKAAIANVFNAYVGDYYNITQSLKNGTLDAISNGTRVSSLPYGNAPTSIVGKAVPMAFEQYVDWTITVEPMLAARDNETGTYQRLEAKITISAKTSQGGVVEVKEDWIYNIPSNRKIVSLGSKYSIPAIKTTRTVGVSGNRDRPPFNHSSALAFGNRATDNADDLLNSGYLGERTNGIYFDINLFFRVIEIDDKGLSKTGVLRLSKK